MWGSRAFLSVSHAERGLPCVSEFLETLPVVPAISIKTNAEGIGRCCSICILFRRPFCERIEWRQTTSARWQSAASAGGARCRTLSSPGHVPGAARCVKVAALWNLIGPGSVRLGTRLPYVLAPPFDVHRRKWPTPQEREGKGERRDRKNVRRALRWTCVSIRTMGYSRAWFALLHNEPSYLWCHLNMVSRTSSHFLPSTQSRPRHRPYARC